ncbi:uncharacterized protein LOC111191023 [Astyanax mexicanus]|uniref:uncharacterized protein LOC111191023 n=1 Tax=Astyanax mexicanus TaxID=7994 RepID=UPI0020CB052D|nr:uncharacterized protein LOC111191023 [Astyanax mexicanus]
MSSRSQTCPICRAIYANLSQHITRFHGVGNEREKELLLQLASERVKGTFKCQVPGCSKSVKRLDRHHSEVHFDIEPSVLSVYLSRAKRCFVIEKLAELRASKPNIPMVSYLDIGYQPDVDVPVPVSAQSPAATSSNAAAATTSSKAAAATTSSKAAAAANAFDEMAPDVGIQEQERGEEEDKEEHKEEGKDKDKESEEGEVEKDEPCTSRSCQRLVKKLREQVRAAQEASQVADRICKGECFNPDCLRKAEELSSLMSSMLKSPNLQTRRKFSRRV